jgi:hypothetical protein
MIKGTTDFKKRAYGVNYVIVESRGALSAPTLVAAVYLHPDD